METALIGRENRAKIVRAAADIARVNGGAASQERVGLGWTTVVREGTDQWISDCHPSAADGAISCRRQDVVSLRSDRPRTVFRIKDGESTDKNIVVPSDDTVLEVDNDTGSIDNPAAKTHTARIGIGQIARNRGIKQTRRADEIVNATTIRVAIVT